MVVLPNGEVSHQTVKELKLRRIDTLVRGLRPEITDPARTRFTRYEEGTKELHRLFIDPILADLKSAGINNLVFSTDSNLQDISPAILQDEAGEFLIEKFSISSSPSMQMIKVDDYVSLKGAEMLKMGATQFTGATALPGVLGELGMVAELQQELNPQQNQLVYLNEQFTLENLQQKIQQLSPPIVHLGTHGESTLSTDSYLLLGTSEQGKICV
jgi:CHAT domain-containing protein